MCECGIGMYDMTLERPFQGLQFYNQFFFNWDLYVKFMSPQSCRIHNLAKLGVFGTPS